MGVAVEEMAQDRAYKLWFADLYQCPVCGHRLIAEYATRPYAVADADESYSKKVEEAKKNGSFFKDFELSYVLKDSSSSISPTPPIPFIPKVEGVHVKDAPIVEKPVSLPPRLSGYYVGRCIETKERTLSTGGCTIVMVFSLDEDDLYPRIMYFTMLKASTHPVVERLLIMAKIPQNLKEQEVENNFSALIGKRMLLAVDRSEISPSQPIQIQGINYIIW
jgi:hypothetical protein